MPDEQTPMPRQSQSQRKRRAGLQYPTVQREKDTPPPFLEVCWPLAGGLILAFVAPYLYSDLLWAPHWMMWIVFPFVVLAGRRDLGLNDQLTAMLPQIILVIQFPIDGILGYVGLTRRAPVLVAFAPALILHAAGWFILTMLSIYMK
ncbi:MAG: hypothetical protein ABSF28_14075 [Terracidiphilus sp.]|jgi:hypothetical protein